MTKHRLNELEAQNAALLARVIALETALAAWLPPAPEEVEERTFCDNPICPSCSNGRQTEEPVGAPSPTCRHCGRPYTTAPGLLPAHCPECGHYPDQGPLNCSCDACQHQAHLIDRATNQARARRIASGGER